MFPKTTALSKIADLPRSLPSAMSTGQTLCGAVICSVRHSPLKGTEVKGRKIASCCYVFK